MFFCDILVRFAFATQPTNTTALQNSNTFINCEVDGTEVINITWISPNGFIINRVFSYISIVASSSSTRFSSSLQFANVQMSQSEGWYTCRCFSYNGTTENIISIAAGAFLYVQGEYICNYAGDYTLKEQSLINRVLHYTSFYKYGFLFDCEKGWPIVLRLYIRVIQL